MKEVFKKIRFEGQIAIKMTEGKGIWRADKKTLLNQITAICEEYKTNGDVLTLRQLYYQLVSVNAIANDIKVYKKLSVLKDQLCYAGILDWDCFEDRGRKPVSAYYEHSIEDALDYTARNYVLDRSLGQTNRVEVWCEKDAISEILKKVALPYGARLCVNKGYMGTSAIYNAYERFSREFNQGHTVTILYFGDHDPSGLDMVRDIRERLTFMFEKGVRCRDFMEFDFNVISIGLTMEQIETYNPPPNPAKVSDPRAAEYIEKYGPISWEVDALKPGIMREILEHNIKEQYDLKQYETVLEQEQEDRVKIRKLINKIS